MWMLSAGILTAQVNSGPIAYATDECATELFDVTREQKCKKLQYIYFELMLFKYLKQ